MSNQIDANLLVDKYKLFEKLITRKLISNKWKWIIRVVVISIWGLLFLSLIWTAWKSRYQIVPILAGADYSNVVMVCVYYLLSLIAALLGWHTIIHSYHYAPNWWRNVQIFCVTVAPRRLPGTIWYIGGRMYLYQKLGMSKRSVLEASIVELIVSFLSAGIVGISMFFHLGFALPGLLLIPILVTLIIIAIIMTPGILDRLFKPNNSKTQNNWRFIIPAIWIFAYSIMWIMSGLMASQIVSIVQPVDWHNMGFIVGSWAFSGMAGLLTIFLPSTFGAMELSFIGFLSRILPLPIAGVVAISTRLLTFSMDMLLSLVFYPILIKFPLDRSLSS